MCPNATIEFNNPNPANTSKSASSVAKSVVGRPNTLMTIGKPLIAATKNHLMSLTAKTMRAANSSFGTRVSPTKDPTMRMRLKNKKIPRTSTTLSITIIDTNTCWI
uniref:Uncharacterized protein n=1 Tax=Bionectria ochroleuca TaxID=29856 RepID=A0A8H7K699_BIOOC